MLGFRDFVMSKDFGFLDASDSANSFLSLVLEKLEKQPRHIASVMPELLPAIEYLARNQSQFGAEESIYGNFLEKLARIKTLYSPLIGS